MKCPILILMIQIIKSREVYLSTKNLKNFLLIQFSIQEQENILLNQNLVIQKESLEMLKESVLLMMLLGLQRKMEVLIKNN